MAPKKEGSAKRVLVRGAWTAEEDRKLAQYIEKHGAKKWKTVAAKAGLNRCGKSCRLRWLNYLRPNIKRGNISLEEEDLILRLHKLLGNRWSLIAGRIPGRTDNEIKNYWNSHLSKKVNSTKNKSNDKVSNPQEIVSHHHQPINDNCEAAELDDEGGPHYHLGDFGGDITQPNFDVDEFLDFSGEDGTMGIDWIYKFLDLDEKS